MPALKYTCHKEPLWCYHIFCCITGTIHGKASYGLCCDLNILCAFWSSWWSSTPAVRYKKDRNLTWPWYFHVCWRRWRSEKIIRVQSVVSAHGFGMRQKAQDHIWIHSVPHLVMSAPTWIFSSNKAISRCRFLTLNLHTLEQKINKCFYIVYPVCGIILLAIGQDSLLNVALAELLWKLQWVIWKHHGPISVEILYSCCYLTLGKRYKLLI